MDRRPILLRCDASARAGLGHAGRCLALAEELSRSGARAVFAMAEDDEGIEWVRAAGARVLRRAPDEGEEWLGRVARATSARAVVLDARDDFSRDAVEDLRRSGLAVATIDDGSERRLAADLAFYPPAPQVAALGWSGFRGRLHTGFEWVVLRPAIARGATARGSSARRSEDRADCPPRPGEAARPTVVVTVGATDTHGLTAKVVEALDLVGSIAGPSALEGECDVFVVAGPWFRDPALDGALEASRRRPVVLRGVRDMARLLACADLAIAAFGTTAYELAALGVPAILLCPSDDDALAASALAEAGAARVLSGPEGAAPAGIAAAVAELLASPRLRERLSAAGPRVLDGRGAGRVARTILDFLDRRHD